VQPWWKTILRFLKKLKIELPYDSASPLLGFNPKKLKLDSPRDIFIPVFVAGLFTITNTGKQPKCPLMYQWIDIWYIYIMECCVCVCVCASSVTQLCLILREPMDCSSPGLPALHSLQEFSQTHVHWVSDEIQPSRLLLPLVFWPSIFHS